MRAGFSIVFKSGRGQYFLADSYFHRHFLCATQRNFLLLSTSERLLEFLTLESFFEIVSYTLTLL